MDSGPPPPKRSTEPGVKPPSLIENKAYVRPDHEKNRLEEQKRKIWEKRRKAMLAKLPEDEKARKTAVAEKAKVTEEEDPDIQVVFEKVSGAS